MSVKEIIEAVLRLLETLITWPIVLLFLVLYFRHMIPKLVRRVEKLPGGIEFSKVTETAVNLGAAAVANKVAGEDEIRQIVRFVVGATETGAIGRLSGKRVLWVDDEPQNNEYSIKALQAQGVEVITSKTTREALEEVNRRNFDVIITDQLRHEDGIRRDEAGYELIRTLRNTGVKAPVILSTAFPNEVEARNHGFYGATNTQHGVFELVLKAIQGA
jgi:CheY-like chemotaxis protein